MQVTNPSINNDLIDLQFQRTRNIKDDKFKDFPKNCIVIGLGGIGGHVADILSSIPSIENIVLFDDDIIELSNLNRTVYQYSHIGQYKVAAMAEIISSRNVRSSVYPINMKFNERSCEFIRSSDELDFLKHLDFLVFDCRDNFFGDYDLFNTISSKKEQFKVIRAAYNKMSVTIDLNPSENPVWGSGGYNEDTGSHSIPSRLVATLITMCAAEYNRLVNTPLFHIPLTFDAMSIIDFIFKGITINKLAGKDRDEILTTLEKKIHEETKGN